MLRSSVKSEPFRSPQWNISSSKGISSFVLGSGSFALETTNCSWSISMTLFATVFNLHFFRWFVCPPLNFNKQPQFSHGIHYNTYQSLEKVTIRTNITVKSVLTIRCFSYFQNLQFVYILHPPSLITTVQVDLGKTDLTSDEIKLYVRKNLTAAFCDMVGQFTRERLIHVLF